MYEDEPPSEESIRAVKRVVKNVDGLLSIPEYVKYRNKSEPNIGSIIDDFGGLWRDVQISAGIPNPTIFSKDECIEAIQHVSKLIDDSPTRREYKLVSDQPPQIYIEALFGDWFEAKKEANCHISNEDTYSKKKKFRDEDYYLKDISGTNSKLSEEIRIIINTTDEFYSPEFHNKKADVFFAESISAAYEGGWNSAINCIYYGHHPFSSRKYSRGDCIQELYNLYNQIGRIPTSKDLKEKSEISHGVISNRFGTFTRARKIAGLDSTDRSKIDNRYYGSDWQKYRQKAIDRDENKCSDCGTDESTLQVHHIIPFYEFPKSIGNPHQLSNLASLCPHCHPRFESMPTKAQCKFLNMDWSKIKRYENERKINNKPVIELPV